jgi:hypothetical protein
MCPHCKEIHPGVCPIMAACVMCGEIHPGSCAVESVQPTDYVDPPMGVQSGIHPAVNAPYARHELEVSLEEVIAANEKGTLDLYDADPTCKHEIVDGRDGSGIRCKKCRGWFCY